MRANQKYKKSNHSKMVAMVIFLIVDLALNSTLDFDVFNNKLGKNFLLGLLGLQVVVQISVFLILFLAVADTFLFRVGLIGILLRTVRFVLILQPIYLAFTLAEGIFRVRHLSKGLSLTALWSDNTFIALSYVHKIGMTTQCTVCAQNTHSNLIFFFYSGDTVLYLQRAHDDHSGGPHLLQQGRLDLPH